MEGVLVWEHFQQCNRGHSIVGPGDGGGGAGVRAAELSPAGAHSLAAPDSPGLRVFLFLHPGPQWFPSY